MKYCFKLGNTCCDGIKRIISEHVLPMTHRDANCWQNWFIGIQWGYANIDKINVKQSLFWNWGVPNNNEGNLIWENFSVSRSSTLQKGLTLGNTCCTLASRWQLPLFWQSFWAEKIDTRTWLQKTKCSFGQHYWCILWKLSALQLVLVHQVTVCLGCRSCHSFCAVCSLSQYLLRHFARVS